MTFFCHVLAVRFNNMLFEHRNSNQILESDNSDLGFFLLSSMLHNSPPF